MKSFLRVFLILVIASPTTLLGVGAGVEVRNQNKNNEGQKEAASKRAAEQAVNAAGNINLPTQGQPMMSPPGTPASTNQAGHTPGREVCEISPNGHVPSAVSGDEFATFTQQALAAAQDRAGEGNEVSLRNFAEALNAMGSAEDGIYDAIQEVMANKNDGLEDVENLFLATLNSAFIQLKAERKAAGQPVNNLAADAEFQAEIARRHHAEFKTELIRQGMSEAKAEELTGDVIVACSR